MKAEWGDAPPPRALGFSREQSARPNHHAIIYRRVENSRPAVLVPAPSRTNLGQFFFPVTTLNNFLCPTTPRHPSSRWTGQTPLVEPPSIPAHPAPIPYKFSGRQVTALTTEASNSPSPVNPPPTYLYTGSRKDSPPILNSLPTHTSSTVPTPSISPVLQEPADVTIT